MRSVYFSIFFLCLLFLEHSSAAFMESAMLRKILCDPISYRIDDEKVYQAYKQNIFQLIEEGASVNTGEYGTQGVTPISWAAMHGDLAMIEKLLELKADVEGDGRYRPIDYVLGSLPMVKVLVNAGSSLSSDSSLVIPYKNAILDILARDETESKKTDLLAYFLEKGEDPFGKMVCSGERVQDPRYLLQYLSKYTEESPEFYETVEFVLEMIETRMTSHPNFVPLNQHQHSLLLLADIQKAKKFILERLNRAGPTCFELRQKVQNL